MKTTISLSSAVALLVVGCVVSSFDKVDDIGPGSGGTAGQEGGAGSAGQAQCGTPCDDGADGETGCCFDQPEGTVDECGYQVSDYGNVCLPKAAAGVPDEGCSASVDGLAGCCTQNGVCGYEDPAHGLGCMLTEAFGDVAQSCGQSPCGIYCLHTEVLGCSFFRSDVNFPIWDCAERCVDRHCLDQIAAVSALCSLTNDQCLANGDPAYYVADWDGECRELLYALATCFEADDGFGPECTQYCALVTSACTAEDAQYASPDDCLSICARLFAGDALQYGSLQSDATSSNTLACRLAAIGDGTTSVGATQAQACAGAGPAGDFGDGAFKCGNGICESYCTLMNAVCSTEFEYVGVTECVDACSSSETFTWSGSPTGDTTTCRFNEVMLAITDSEDHTAHCENARSDSRVCTSVADAGAD